MLRILLLCFPLFLSAQFKLQEQVLQLANDPQLSGTKWSICAIDLTNGDTLASFDARQQIPGASIAKLASTAAALHVLGPQHTVSTQLYLEGEMLANGVWNGHLRIVGNGDVSLGSKFFCEAGKELQFITEWVGQVQKRGIKRITGSVIADATQFGTNVCPLGWEQVDMGNYYGCGAFGLNFFDNTLKLNFKTGPVGNPIQLLSIYPNDAYFKLDIQALSGNVSNDQTFVYGEPFLLNRTIKGKLPANRSSFMIKASMPDPERLLADLFCTALKAAGIEVDNGAMSARQEQPNLNPTPRELLYEQKGRSLQEIVYWTNQRSVNLFAEGTLLQLGYKRFGAGTYENSLVVLDSLLHAWELGPCRLVDGSGLSRFNRLSAAQYTQLLAKQQATTYFDIYYKSLPIAGISGTVSSLCKDQAAAGKVHVKSGTMEGVKAYAGYVDSKSGHPIAFAIIANDYQVSNALLIKKIEPFLNSLATY